MATVLKPKTRYIAFCDPVIRNSQQHFVEIPRIFIHTLLTTWHRHMLITGCFVRFAPVSIDVSLAEELLDINHGIQVISADSRTLQRRCHTINIPIISALYAMCENVFVLNTDFHTTEESLPFPGTYVFAKFVSSWLVHCRVKPNLHDDFAMLDELGTMLFCRVWAKKGMVVR